MIPSKLSTDLSDEARALLREARRDGGYSTRLTDDQIPAAREVAEAHLGHLRFSSYGNSLTPISPAKDYTVAEGSWDRGFYAEVEVLRGASDRGGVLLASLIGADYHRQDSGGQAPWPQWRLRTRHASATDVEHDPSTLADLRIENPVVTDLYPDHTVLVGMLSDLRLYSRGTDITLLNDRNPEQPLAEPELCDDPSCIDAHGVHAFAPYLPPERDELGVYLGKMVRITLRPQTSVDAHGLPVGTSSIVEPGSEE